MNIIRSFFINSMLSCMLMNFLCKNKSMKNVHLHTNYLLKRFRMVHNKQEHIHGVYQSGEMEARRKKGLC